MARKKKTKRPKVDIGRHKLVPHHKIISKDEEKKLLKEHNIEPDQLPKILKDDPVAVSIGAKPGSILKVVRESQTADEAVAYRLVVETSK
ncbi:MAG: DNA-directed RNA polymerase subunit H [Candidatus Thermoplasmatota archaeon]